MAGLIGLIIFIIFAGALGSAFSEAISGMGNALADMVDDAERDGLSALGALKAFFVLIPLTVVLFNGGVFLVALIMAILGYAFDQDWGFYSPYAWLGGFFSPAYVRWHLGAHGVIWLLFVFDHWKSTPKTK